MIYCLAVNSRDPRQRHHFFVSWFGQLVEGLKQLFVVETERSKITPPMHATCGINNFNPILYGCLGHGLD